MKTHILEGKKINTEVDFHKEISLILGLGEYYGNNLDALWDNLNYDVERPVLIIWRNATHSKKQLGDTFEKIIGIFEMIKKQDLDYGMTKRFDFLLE